MANTIDLIIRAINQASPELKKVQTDLKGVEAAADESGASLGSIFKGLAAGAALGVGVAGVMQMTQAIGDMAVQAGKVEQLRSSFDGLSKTAGQSSQAIMAAMREASAGLVSDADLMLSANKAMLLGVADTADELVALLNVARSRGAAMGLSMTQAFNDIVTGLGRESALILDNLGITINLEQVMSDYAASLGKTSAALDATERKQALLNEVMRQSGNITAPIETAATAWERASVAIENAKVALGELFGPVVTQALHGTTAVANATSELFADNIDNSVKFAEALTTVQQAQAVGLPYADAYAKAMNEMSAVLLTGGKLTEEQYQRVDLIQQQLTNDLALWSAGMVDAGDESEKLAGSTQQSASSMIVAQTAATNLKAALAGLASQSDTTGSALRNAFLGAAGLLGADVALAGLTEQRHQLDLLRQEWQLSGLTAEQIQFREAAFIDATNKKLADQRDAITGANKAASNYASDGLNAVKQKLDDIASKTSGLITDQLNLGVTWDQGPYKDAINENAKRMAAIANEGLIGQSWLPDMAAEVPDLYKQVIEASDPRGFARQWLTEFQAGMHPEALDREQAKQNIVMMMTGQNTMNAFINDLVAEIEAEEGLKPIVNAFTGGVIGGVNQEKFGEKLGAATVTSVATTEAVTQFQNAGASAFGSWRTGWENAASEWNVPPPNSGGTATGGTASGLPSGPSAWPPGVPQVQGPVNRPQSGPPAWPPGVGGAKAGFYVEPGLTTSRTGNNVGISITINAPGGSPSAVAFAAQTAVLDAVRSAGLR